MPRRLLVEGCGRLWKVGTPHRKGCSRRAAEAMASRRTAEAALRIGWARPEPSDGPGRRTGAMSSDRGDVPFHRRLAVGAWQEDRGSHALLHILCRTMIEARSGRGRGGVRESGGGGSRLQRDEDRHHHGLPRPRRVWVHGLPRRLARHHPPTARCEQHRRRWALAAAPRGSSRLAYVRVGDEGGAFVQDSVGSDGMLQHGL